MAKYKPLMIPGIAFVVILALFLFLVPFLLGQINSLKGQITAAKSQSAVLSERVTTLQQANAQVLDLSDDVYAALPADSPSSQVLFQLRRIASENDIKVNRLNISNVTIEGESLKRTVIDADMEGSYESVIILLTAMQELAPIINIDKLKLEKEADTINLSGSFVSYWAELPATIADQDPSALALTDQEQQILSVISQLQASEFSQVPPTAEVQRPNPFSIQ